MTAPEGFCLDCGAPVRRFATATGWKHTAGGRSRIRACPSSPPSRVRLPGESDPEVEALRLALGPVTR